MAPHIRAIRNEAQNPGNHRQRSHEIHRSQEARHFEWLKKHFTDCFGLPPDMYKRRRLLSFDGDQLAKGYNRVVATWQGMYFHLRVGDIMWTNFGRVDNPNSNVITWSIQGVKIFRKI